MIEPTEFPNTYDGTPTGFRNVYDEWRKTAPPNDSDVIPDKPRFAKIQRRASKQSFLKSMLVWRAMQESRDPLQTNFLQAGFDDEIISDDGSISFPQRDVESEWEDRPTINEMMNPLKGVVFKTSKDSVISYSEYGPSRYFRKRLIPDREATENKSLIGYGQEYESGVVDETKPAAFPGCILKPIVRLGRLFFSDAISHSKYRLGSVVHFGNRGPWSTPINEPGTPNGLSETFFPPPEIQRLNQLDRLIAMEDAVAANDNLAPEHVKTLDTAITARNFQEVGEQFGYRGKTAERHGKRLVLNACQALDAVLERLAA